jgi:tetratricopeptide (TPR) repeat protein
LGPVDDLDLLQFRLQFREAQSLLKLPAKENPRIFLLQARAQAGLRHRHQAYAEYARARAMDPDNPLVLLEAHRNHAFYWVSWELFSLAAYEYARATELAPDDVDLWRFQAISHLANGDEEAYRNTCRAMMEKFINTTSAGAASSVTEVCVCRPDAIEIWQPLMPLAEIGSRYVSDSRRLLAAAQYRAGDYQAAVDSYLQVARLHRLRAFDLFFLAMCHYQLKREEEAERRLGEAEAWINEANRSAQSNENPFVEVAQWGAWTERPETNELQREAIALIRPAQTASQIPGR